MTTLIAILFSFVIVVAVSICASLHPGFCLYNQFVVNPIEDGKVDKSRNFYIEFKKNILSIKSGVINKQVLFSAPIADCDMLFEREYTPKEVQIVEKDKSVIGRAVVGGVLLGPVGAVVGGMSGIGTNKNEKVVQQEKNDIYVTISSNGENRFYKVAVANNEPANAVYRHFYNLKRKLA